MKTIQIIGGGLAGTECAYQLALGLEELGLLDYQIRLYEMRPQVKTPAHHTSNLAELVCSNSLGSELLSTARGLLIQEMKYFKSLIVQAAIAAKVPAGQALAVDRDIFAREITQAIETNSRIKIIREEFTEDLDLNSDNYLVIATGPLTSPTLAGKIQKLLQEANPQASSSYLHFFDAAAPIITAESINMDIAFKASRYGKGSSTEAEGDYINCPFYDQDQFDKFYDALISAERAPLKDFEKENAKFFQGCQPVEKIAESGRRTLTFGPMKPVGLRDPRDPERRPYAVVQLRQDNVVGSLYNLVGFQTNLKWSEQKRVFAMIPGLENIDIVRYGVMHQNIFINSPLFLDSNLNLLKSDKTESNIFFAGQITGVEGYTESAATGIVVARSILSRLNAKALHPSPSTFYLPKETMLGALVHYVSSADPKHFQPINSNWGILNFDPEGLDIKLRKNKDLKYAFFVKIAQENLAAMKDPDFIQAHL